MNTATQKEQGFSLMELMVVIAIIGILVAIAIPTYQVYTRRAHFTEVVHAAQPYKLGVQECYQVTGELEHCTTGAHGIPKAVAAGSEQGLINAITVARGVITVTPNNKYGITAHDTYILTPTIRQGAISWKTSGGALAEGYVN